MISLAFASMRARLFPIVLVILALTSSMALLLAVDRIKVATQNGFNQSLSGVDLVLGPRGSGIELMLYTVFHLGKPTNNITTETLKDIAQNPKIEWAVPIALGDSHRGYRVIATSSEYFERIKFSGDQSLHFTEGVAFQELKDVVIGSAVADTLGYAVGTPMFVTHGSGSLDELHDDFAFQVTGVLAPTGTPTDRAIFVSLEGYELIHLGWSNGSQAISLKNIDVQKIPTERLYPQTITAAYLGLSSKLGLFQVARSISEYNEEAVSAIIPGVALAELWSIVGSVDSVFKLLNWLIVGISIIAMMTMTMTALESRTREMTILRALGATPLHLSSIILAEVVLISGFSGLLAIGLVRLLTWVSVDVLSEWAGIRIELIWITMHELFTLGLIVLAGLVASLIPAGMVYKRSLHRGFSS
ncbi:MAG: ABC transporter permease [Litoricolaceae bacterium]|nr:ABC transporter permease [Litorivicinaceae bacterium]